MPASWPAAGALMTREPVTVAHDALVSQAIGHMRARGIHELPVLRGRKLIGMFSFESIARRANLSISTKVEHLLLLPPVVTERTPYPELAEQLLASGLRAAPVVGPRGELVGVVSRTDLVRAFPTLPLGEEHTVDEIARAVGHIFRETDTVRRLLVQIRLLEEHPLPVVDRRGRLVGAVGVADLTRVLWRPTAGGRADRRTVGSAQDVELGTIMHSPAITVPSGTPAVEAARRMSEEKVSSVFVVEGGRPVSVVGQTDLLGLAVGRAGPGAGRMGDVYVQITGLRGSGDPGVLSEIDRVVGAGLRRISRHVRPSVLNLHFETHATHQAGGATVEARLHTDKGTFYASHTGWSLLPGIATLMDEISEQVRRAQEPRRARARARAKARVRRIVTEEEPSDPDLEARIRQATGDDAE